MAQSSMVQSVLKALDILQLAGESRNGMRLNEIAEALDMKKTTAHNLIRSLRARGFLEKDAANRFSPGPALATLAATRHRNSMLTAATAEFRELNRRFPRAVLTLSELTPSSIQTRLRMSPDRPGELQYPRERVVMPYVTPTAIVLQATGSNAGAFEHNYSFEEYGIGQWKKLEDFLEIKRRVHECGYSMRDHGDGRLAVAFAIPENFALGFSVDQYSDELFEQIKQAAAEFHRKIQE